MQRLLAVLIALGMIGWYGFNVGLGGAALNALLGLHRWVGPLLIGTPVLILSLRGLKNWNGLAALTTILVLVLVGLLVSRLGALENPVNLQLVIPEHLLTDTAVFVGYISVFIVRAPDFTARLQARKDLAISALLLCVPIVLIALAGISLQRVTGSSDLIGILASPEGLAMGNLLITASVIAPAFTTLYSGAPALRTSFGLPERAGMILISLIGMVLAFFRFDQRLISWVIVLAAMLPPVVIPLIVESTRRRRGHTPKIIPFSVWLPGALVALILTFAEIPQAPLAGLLLSGIVTGIWYLNSK